MFSTSFLKFVIGYTEDKDKIQEKETQEIEFRPVKVKEAAKVVIESIKETF